MPQEQYRLKDINAAIFLASKELYGTTPIDPNITGNPKFSAWHGREYVQRKIYSALNKAREDGGTFWKEEKKTKAGYNLVHLDVDHTTGVFEALNEMAKSDNPAGNRMRKAHMTPEVIFRAEEILFDINKGPIEASQMQSSRSDIGPHKQELPE